MIKKIKYWFYKRKEAAFKMASTIYLEITESQDMSIPQLKAVIKALLSSRYGYSSSECKYAITNLFNGYTELSNKQCIFEKEQCEKVDE